MITYTYGLSNLVIVDALASYKSGDDGLLELLGQILLSELKRLARGGFLSNYEEQNESLGTLRGRLDMGYIATHPRTATLRCRYDDFRVDHSLNRVLAAGVRLAAREMNSKALRFDLARSADRFLGDVRRIQFGMANLDDEIAGLDRRSSHYRTALELLRLILKGTGINEYEQVGGTRVSSFVLNMNTLFEQFLERYFRSAAPPGVEVFVQDRCRDVFWYVDNDKRKGATTIQPDLVLRSSVELSGWGMRSIKIVLRGRHRRRVCISSRFMGWLMICRSHERFLFSIRWLMKISQGMDVSSFRRLRRIIR